ncbi:MAG: polyprenyl synthetase family protein [Planctomycetes bacterium]|nr:polyprenyl synthetase family protein [Planctomycetota bacterium]
MKSYFDRAFQLLYELIHEECETVACSRFLRICAEVSRSKLKGYNFIPSVELPLRIYSCFCKADSKLVPFLSACTALHCGADILDDIADRDIPARLRKIDSDILVLSAFELLNFVSHSALERLKYYSVPEKIVARLKNDFDKTLLKMLQGQTMDLAASAGETVSVQHVGNIVAMKSGSQIELFCRAAAILAGANNSQIENLSLFGRYLGISLQVSSDCNDIWCKKTSSDLKNGRVTLPVAFALKTSSKKGILKKLLKTAAGADSRGYTHKKIRNIIKDSGALMYVALMTSVYKRKACNFLKRAVGMKKSRLFLDILNRASL